MITVFIFIFKTNYLQRRATRHDLLLPKGVTPVAFSLFPCVMVNLFYCNIHTNTMSEIEDLEKKLVDLKRQRRELESECPECNIKKTEDEDCPECRVAVGIGMYLNICKEIDSEKNCQKLFEEVDTGKITPEEFFDIIKEKAKDDPEKLDILEYTDELMESGDASGGGNPKPKRVEILENEYNHYVEDGLKVTLLRAGKENTDDFRGGTWYVNQIYEGQRISYQEGAVGRRPVGVGGSELYKKVVVLKNPYIMEWKEGHTEGQIVVDLAEDILGKEKVNQLKKGITGYKAEQSFARLEKEISKKLKNRSYDSVFVVAKVGSQPAIPQQTFILG